MNLAPEGLNKWGVVQSTLGYVPYGDWELYNRYAGKQAMQGNEMTD